MQEPVTYDLVDPITIAGRTIDKLTFRPPTGRDIIDCGNPFPLASGAPAPAAVIGAMIARLAGIEGVFVDRLSLTDWNGCEVAILTFQRAPGAISKPSTST